MSEASQITEFGTFVRAAFSRFKTEEQVIRAEYASKVEAGDAPKGLDVDDMLERRTRRFLIDPMLRALDWNPDDPNWVTEEARSFAENSDRLYFDYLGVSRGKTPVLILEAKGVDAEAARPPWQSDVPGAGMARLISEALGILKAKSRPSTVLAQWATWLDDLRTYVRSLSPVHLKTLRRVVITSGRWLIIFADPFAAFIDDGEPEQRNILCFTSAEEIVEQHAKIYRALARARLTDILPLTLTLGEALQVLQPSAVAEAYRGVVVATRVSGGVRVEYPTRAVYPALVLISGGRAFATVDYNPMPLEEPRDAAEMEAFLALLNIKGEAFEQRALTEFGRPDLTPTSVDRYPSSIREPEIVELFAAAPGSTAALIEAATPLRPQLVYATGERGAEHEYLVITGQARFYKTAIPFFGSYCDCHSFLTARKRGLANKLGSFDRLTNAFTISNDPQHCENDEIYGMRSGRCQLGNIESHLCCRACVFHDICWSDEDLPRLPCGK